MLQSVIKRNGKEELYDNKKIKVAVGKAFDDASKKKEYGYLESYKNQLQSDATFYVEKRLKNTTKVDIERIQDLLEEFLIQECFEVGKCFMVYRAERSKQRDAERSLKARVKSIINCENVQNANANVDEYGFGGRKYESAGELHKEMALEDYLSERVSKAHLENEAYQHDLDSASVGMHNCLFADLPHVLKNGFVTRNGDVRQPKSISSAMQLVAVIFQCQSQVQFGGVASMHIDYDLAPYVNFSFRKHLKKYLKRKGMINEFEKLFCIDDITPSEKWYEEITKSLHLDNLRKFKLVWQDAMEDLEEEGAQAAEALYHNLNTLESRPGSQLPFTSINYGRDTSAEGRLVTKWLLQASINGIGWKKDTAIFPIAVFQLKGGVNKYPTDPNYDLYQMAIESLSKRIYPNISNNDWSQNIEDPNDPDTYLATMG